MLATSGQLVKPCATHLAGTHGGQYGGVLAGGDAHAGDIVVVELECPVCWQLQLTGRGLEVQVARGRVQYLQGLLRLEGAIGLSPEHPECVARRDLDALAFKQRPVAVQGADLDGVFLPLLVGQHQRVGLVCDEINAIAIHGFTLVVPPLHDHPLAIGVTLMAGLAIEPYRGKDVEGVILPVQLAAIPQGAADMAG